MTNEKAIAKLEALLESDREEIGLEAARLLMINELSTMTNNIEWQRIDRGLKLDEDRAVREAQIANAGDDAERLGKFLLTMYPSQVDRSKGSADNAMDIIQALTEELDKPIDE